MSKKSRRIVVEFFAPITIETARSFLSSVMLHVDEASELILLIDSTGGSVKLAYSLASFVVGLEGDVTTVNVGLCASAAIMLFCAGRKRIVNSAAKFCLHKVSSKDAENIRANDHRLALWTNRIAKFVEDRTGRHSSCWKADMEACREFDSSDSVKVGLALRAGKFCWRKNDMHVRIVE